MRFGFLMYPAFEELDLIGPWEMATVWSEYAKGPECLSIAQQRGEVRCAKGLRVVADHDYASVGKLDYLLVPGGVSAFEELKNPATIDFVREQARSARAVLSVCTGSFILQAAGLLEGRRATSHWKTLGAFRKLGVEVVEERFVRDANVWTSAGVSAGIDMLLAFIAEEAGEAAAHTVQMYSEYYPDGRVYGEPAAHPQAPAYVRRSVSPTAR